MSERQLSKSTVNRQLPIGRVDVVDAFELTTVYEGDGKVDGRLTLFQGGGEKPSCRVGVDCLRIALTPIVTGQII
jgi:hypothetical protein